MTILESLASNPELVNEAAKEATGLIKTIFGKSFEEYGGLIGDNVKLRRFKNQIKIFKKAEEFLKQEGIDPNKIDLKVLAPMIEYSSLEENEKLQEKWAFLIKNIAAKSFSTTFQLTCIGIINKMSSDEASLLDYLFNKLNQKRNERANRDNLQPVIFGDKLKKKPNDYRIDWFTFELKKLSRELNKSLEDLELQISNLVSLGTLKYVPEVDVLGATIDKDSDDGDVDIELDVSDYEKVQLTKLGYMFVELCEK